MTIEEAINMLYGIRADNLNLNDAYTKDKYDALNMAIKALEQEERIMTREEAINVITNADLSKVEDRVIKAIFYLCTNKSLEQEQKTGHWIESDYGNMISQHRWYCSECGGMHYDTKTGEWREVFDSRYAYCPLCGARMFEPKERSDKE